MLKGAKNYISRLKKKYFLIIFFKIIYYLSNRKKAYLVTALMDIRKQSGTYKRRLNIVFQYKRKQYDRKAEQGQNRFGKGRTSQS